MCDRVTLSNGLTLGGLLQQKESAIRQLQEENKLLQAEKANLSSENQTVLQEQARDIAKLNEQLSMMTSEQTKHFSTVELLDTVKMEKSFLEEELSIQYENTKKQKNRIKELEDIVSEKDTVVTELNTTVEKLEKTLTDEKKESYVLSCLIGERDVIVEQMQSELNQLKGNLCTLKHSLASKDCKLKSVLDERNKAKWKLQDIEKSVGSTHLKNRTNKYSSIPITPPRISKKSSLNSVQSSSPVTVTATFTPEKSSEDTASSPSVPHTTEAISIESRSNAFNLQEKHYLSLIYRLRSENAKLKNMCQDSSLLARDDATTKKKPFSRQSSRHLNKTNIS